MSKIKCQYCEVFFASPVADKAGGRRCAIRNTTKIINPDSKACRKFRAAHMLACQKTDTFVLTEVCISRHEKGYKLGRHDNCNKCDQFDEIEPAMEDYEPPKRLPVSENEMSAFTPSEMSRSPKVMTKKKSNVITRPRRKPKVVKNESGEKVLIRKRRGK